MATTCLSALALEQLGHAQAEIDRHVAAGPNGRCLACGQEYPCPPLVHAGDTFHRYRRLPRRQPGHASRGRTARGRFSWFARPETAAP